MSVTVVVIADGRVDYLERAMESLRLLHGPVSARLIHDDSGDPEHAAWLWDTYGPAGWLVHSTPQRSGFTEAVRSARWWIGEHDRNAYVWWHEQDFRLTRPIDLAAMCAVLDANPHLAQLALRRQPWNDRERAAGGVVEQYPGDFYEVHEGGRTWLEHRRWFTTNPSLLPRWVVTEHEWPAGAESEGRFGLGLFRDPVIRSGFWGARDSGEWCEHIGTHRAGMGY